VEILSLSVMYVSHAVSIPCVPGTSTGDTTMEGLVALVTLVAPWLLLSLLANGHGVDSRDTLPDDHRR